VPSDDPSIALASDELAFAMDDCRARKACRLAGGNGVPGSPEDRLEIPAGNGQEMVVTLSDQTFRIDDYDEKVRLREGKPQPLARRSSDVARRARRTGIIELPTQAPTRITVRRRGRPAKWARPARPRVAAGLRFFVLLLAVAANTAARPTRPRFEPTDLDLEDTGVAELDLQFGVTHGDGSSGNRFILPDFEFDLGLTPNVEIDIDGAFGFDRYDQATRRYVGEALWTGVKLGFIDVKNDARTRSFALGMQLGPRIATIGDMRGVGYGALALVGLNDRRLHAVLNAGAFVDPGPEITQGQSKSAVGGLDISLDLDAKAVWTLDGEFAGAHYLSPDPDELAAALGASVDVSKNLELSLTIIVGFLPGYDRISMLMGATPKVGLF
jgi:hypothetical protein